MRQGGDKPQHAASRPLIRDEVAPVNDSFIGASDSQHRQGQQNAGGQASLIFDDNIDNNSQDRRQFSKKRSISTRKSSRKSSSHGGAGHGKIGAWQLLRSYMQDPAKRPALFVLLVCLKTYMYNQVDRYLISILASDMQKSQGWYVNACLYMLK